MKESKNIHKVHRRLEGLLAAFHAINDGVGPTGLERKDTEVDWLTVWESAFTISDRALEIAKVAHKALTKWGE